MGRSYFVPRNVKGESRILYIFTVKSFVVTAIFTIFGAGIWYLGSSLMNMSLVAGLIITVLFGVLGWAFATVKIPDLPMMGKFRKAGGEYLSDIFFRAITFNRRKKIYMYNINRGGR